MSLPYAASLATISSLVSDPKLRKPCLGIICGSGLSTLVSSLKNAVEIPYSKLEGFSNSTGASSTFPIVVYFIPPLSDGTEELPGLRLHGQG